LHLDANKSIVVKFEDACIKIKQQMNSFVLTSAVDSTTFSWKATFRFFIDPNILKYQYI